MTHSNVFRTTDLIGADNGLDRNQTRGPAYFANHSTVIPTPSLAASRPTAAAVLAVRKMQRVLPAVLKFHVLGEPGLEHHDHQGVHAGPRDSRTTRAIPKLEAKQNWWGADPSFSSLPSNSTTSTEISVRVLVLIP
jgi:hypothetical protein